MALSFFLLTFGILSAMICLNAEVAQLVEHLTRNEKAVGSSPIFSSIRLDFIKK